MNTATYYHHSNVILNPHIDKSLARTRQRNSNNITFMARTQGRRRKMGMCLVKACAGTGEEESGDQSKTERRSFLTLAEAGLVEISGLGAHEKFLCRLTISSLNLLRVISEQEGCSIEELNAGKICDWFFKDKSRTWNLPFFNGMIPIFHFNTIVHFKVKNSIRLPIEKVESNLRS